MAISLPLLLSCMSASFSNETSSRPRGCAPPCWTKENPSFGHCAVSSLVIEDYFGGVIVVKKIPDHLVSLVGFRDHAFNHIESVGDVDATKEQFAATDFPYRKIIENKRGRRLMRREDLLKDAHLKKNYRVFRDRVTIELLRRQTC